VTPEFIRNVLAAHPETIIYALRLDRGLSPAKIMSTVPGTHWDEERGLDEHQYIVPGAGGVGEILNNAWDSGRGAFVQSYGAKNLDASVLFMPMVGFLPPDDPRILSTVQAVHEELAVDGFVRRYLPEQADDGVDGDEGTFTMCSLWMAGALVSAGRLEEAKVLFDKVAALGNHVGLFSEMLDPRSGEFLGNYPQAFTHIALIHTARNLDLALSRREAPSPDELRVGEHTSKRGAS
jgi:hypothetical protein